MKQDKKVILITGGSQGLGKEVAALMSKENHVAVISNDKESMEEITKELNIEGFYADVTNPSELEKVISVLEEKYGKVDCIINNAGVWTGGELDSNSYDEIAKVLMVNTLGVIYSTRAVLPIMKKQGFGKIINIGSTNGIETKPERSVYIASKWAITGFTGALRKELEKYNISVVGINPGLMSTNLHKNGGSNRDYSCAMDPKDVAEIVKFVADLNEIVVENITFRNLHCEFY